MKANEFVKEKGIDYAIKFLNYDLSIAEDKCELDFGEYENLKRIVESHESVLLAGGLKEAKRAVEGNSLHASYYMQGGTYLRYGNIGVKIVKNGEYKDYFGDIDSKRLVHLDYLPKAIVDVELCQRIQK